MSFAATIIVGGGAAAAGATAATAIGAGLAAGSLAGAREQRKAGERAADAATAAGQASIADQILARDEAAQRLQPFEEFGAGAINPLQTLTGQNDARRAELERLLDRPGNFFSRQRLEDELASLGPAPEALPELPTAFDPNDFADSPILSFLREEGFRDIRESGAGGGRNVDRDLVRFNQGLSSTVLPQLQQQNFNQQLANRGTVRDERQQKISNLLGQVTLGQNAAARTGTNALNTASNVGGLRGGIAQAQGASAFNTADANQNLLGNIFEIGGALLPSSFNAGTGVNSGAPTTFAPSSGFGPPALPTRPTNNLIFS